MASSCVKYAGCWTSTSYGTTAYKASKNAVAERFHRTLNSMIGRMIDEFQRDWDSLLPYVMAAYRSSRHEATQYTPNFLMMGREVRAPVDIVYGSPEASNQARMIIMLMRCSSECCVRTVLFESICRKRLQEASATAIFEFVRSATKLATGSITSIQGSIWDARRSGAGNSLGRAWRLACLGRST